ncbi:hypothetical protein PsorP6_013009 [Peronosclerospora sorghi]|uniref:Uncharacterized protein n=1 Tax=Peronosclerospora sorghi TaxID=230839 RepID=A0ACC0WIQ6_9STRA|nr:hypothetical protein PsorP6_013009 [Peronosclerospora sorghi]
MEKYKAIPLARTTYHSGENDWQDEHVESSDDGYDYAPTSFRAGMGRSVVERMESFKVAHSDRRGSVKRLNELSARAKNFMKIEVAVAALRARVAFTWKMKTR